jgi:hypothetical protein
LSVVADYGEEIPLGEVGAVIDDGDVGAIVDEATLLERQIEPELDRVVRLERRP